MQETLDDGPSPPRGSPALPPPPLPLPVQQQAVVARRAINVEGAGPADGPALSRRSQQHVVDLTNETSAPDDADDS